MIRKISALLCLLYVMVANGQVNGYFNNLETKTTPVMDIRSYGAVSGASDVTSNVISAMTAAVAVGGIVYFPPGVWNINGSINAACDAIICLPSVQPTSSAQQIKFQGATRNRQDAQGPNNVSGSVITTTTTGDTSSAIFGVPTVTAPFGNNIDAYFSDLTIRTYPNPQIGCINMYQAAGAWIDGVRCEVGENYTGTHTQPTNVATGITLPRTGNDTLAGLTRSEITGYYQGVNMSEHAYLNDTWVSFGIQGYFIEPGFNPMTGHFGCEEVGVCIETVGGGQLDADVAIELDPGNVFGCVSWCYTTTDVYDGSNLIKGLVRYYLSEANVGNVSFPIRLNLGGVSSPAATYYNLYTTEFTKSLAPIFTSTGSLPACVGGTGVTCAVVVGSTESRGTITMTLSGVTVATPLVTVNFGTQLAGNPWCHAWQATGTTYYGVYVGGGATGFTFNINNTVSLSGQTSLTVGYACQL